MIDLPRIIVGSGLIGGYSLSAWLRFDRGARSLGIGVVIASLGAMGYGSWVRATGTRRRGRPPGRGAH